jgi:hypothetical protein
MSTHSYVGLSQYLFFHLFTFLTLDTMWHFNVLLFPDVNIINSCLSNIVKGGGLFLSSICFTFCIFVISPDDGWNCLSKHVAYMRHERMSDHLCSWTGLITIQDNSTYAGEMTAHSSRKSTETCRNCIFNAVVGVSIKVYVMSIDASLTC